jgi:hypothetical protein
VFAFVPSLWIACGAGALALFFFWPIRKAAKDYSRSLREAKDKEFARAWAKTFVAALRSPQSPDPSNESAEREAQCAENYNRWKAGGLYYLPKK